MKISVQPLRFSPSFMQNQNNQGNYQNPVNMPMEYLTAAIGPVVGGSIVGAGVYGLTAKITKDMCKLEPKVPNKRLAAILGIVSGFFVGITALIPNLYRASVSGFVKTKEMDVFGRTKSVETNLFEQLDNQTNNPEVSLKEDIDDYFKLQMGKKGSGIVIAT